MLGGCQLGVGGWNGVGGVQESVCGGQCTEGVNANEELCFWGGDVIEMQCFGSMVIECNSRRHPA